MSNKEEGCFLCDAAAASADQYQEKLVVINDGTVFIVMNRFPYNNGHLLVAPNRHTADLTSLTAGENSALIQAVAICEKLLRRTIHPHGFNIGVNIGRAAGAGLPGHVHVHVVPRWEGDTNFMPATTDCKVIPQALDELYCKIVEKLPEVLE